MTSLRISLSKFLAQCLTKLGAPEVSPDLVLGCLEVPASRERGELALPCFRFAKALRVSPAEIASQLEEPLRELLRDLPAIAGVEAQGPYLNFRTSLAHLASAIPGIRAGKLEAGGSSRQGRVMIEYSQPNTHKAFHVGHMRNVALGDAMVRLYRYAGYEVVAANYIGDVGTHIAKCLWAYQNHFQGKLPDGSRGEFLGAMYARADELLDFSRITRYPHPGCIAVRVDSIESHPARKDARLVRIFNGKAEERVVCAGKDFSHGDVVAYAPVGCRFDGRLVSERTVDGVLSRGMILSEKELGVGPEKDTIHKLPPSTAIGQPIAEVGKIAAEAEDSTPIEAIMSQRTQEVSDMLRRLEKNDPPTRELWLETRDWSLKDFQDIYAWIGCGFDHYFYESEVGEDGKKMVQEAYREGKLVESEGAIGADLSAQKLGFFMLLKSDGTGLYATKDLALAKLKFEKFGIERSIHVVGREQNLHFQQVFKTLELLGYPQASRCVHLSYGLVTLPDGKMSSRKGNVVFFSKLRRELSERLLADYLEKYRGTWSDGEIDEAVRRLAVASIRYGMLNQDNMKNIVFDIGEWVSPTGNTGPYLMYAYARTRSILKDISLTEDPGAFNGELLSHPCERDVLASLQHFSETAEKSVEQNKAQLMCIYLYDLARDFSRMYENCPVLTAESENLRQARACLVDATGKTLKKGLELIGIETLERM